MKRYDIDGDTKFIAGQFSKERGFWIKKLSGDLKKSSFPYDKVSAGKQSKKMEFMPFAMSEALVARLIKAGNGSDSRLNMLLIAGLVQALAKYTGNRDIIIGVPIYKQEVEGNFVNTMLTLRSRLEDQMSFKDLLMQVKQNVIEANEHLNYPIESIPHDLGIPYSEGEDFPFFDICLLLENVHHKEHIRGVRPNMIFSFTRAGENLSGEVTYNSKLYKQTTIKQVISHFLYLLRETLFNANSNIAQISALSEAERKEILYDFNDTANEYPGDVTILQLFEKQVAVTPHHAAVVHDDKHVTYEKLNRKANAISVLLRGKGVKSDTVAAIMGKRSIEMVALIFGILKAGGIYLPMNAKDPFERIKFILEDSKPVVLITHKHLLDVNNHSLASVIAMENIILIEDLDPKDEKTGNSRYSTKPGDNIYIIYTSGTTGAPKGVLVKHRGVVNYTWWAAGTYVKNEKVNFPLYTSIAFDLTVTSIFTPLITGNAIVVYGGDTGESLIEKVVKDNRVDVVKLTPSHLKLIRNIKMSGGATRLKRLILGGENLETKLTGQMVENFNGNIEIYNEYGPTETTVGSMIYKFNSKGENRKFVAIGKPIGNTQIYILNKNQEPVPVGAAAKIYISGDGLAAGYLNRPELTADKFNRESPVHIQPPAPFYCTGDLGRRLADGNLEFAGRLDNQVKIRGYRIECGEIENLLLTHEKISDVVVIVTEDENMDNDLCAYIVSDEDFSAAELREFVSASLPDYMVPSYFVNLEKIPLTYNGKLDMRALPKPQASLAGQYVAPTNEIERRMVKIWSEVLAVAKDDLSIDLNFFDLGGHSLKATVLVARIHKEFNMEILLREIFTAPTIRELALSIKKKKEEKFVGIQPVEEREYYPLAPAQKRLYVLQQIEIEDTISYNISIVFEVAGRPDRKKLQTAVARLLNRHENLKTYFEMIGEEPFQRINREVEPEVEFFKTGDDVNESIAAFVRPFELSQAPLLRVGLASMDNERHLLLIDMHHIISDGVSMEILGSDFTELYKEEELSLIRVRYRDYTAWLNKHKKNEVIGKQKDYWLKRFAGDIPKLDLPVDFTRPAVKSFAGGTMDFEITGQNFDLLKKLASSSGVTMFVVLYGIFNVFAAKSVNREDIIIGTPIAGRKHTDLEKIVGMFVNTLALRSCVASGETFSFYLKNIKESTMDAFENQDYQFEDLVNQVEVDRDLSRNPLFDLMFVYDNLEISKMEIPGLIIKPHSHRNQTSKFDLTLEARETTDRLSLGFEYCTGLFKEKTIERFISYFKELVSNILKHPEKKIWEIELISKEEKRRLLFEFNDTKSGCPEDTTIHRLFEEQAAVKPDNPAVVFKDMTLTYAVLNELADRSGRLLKDKGVERGEIIGLISAPSFEMVIGIMAILKAGGAYLPIEPGCPEERLKYILADSGVRLVFMQERLKTGLEGLAEAIYIAIDNNSKFSAKPAGFAAGSMPADAAYVIYTSGSTGKPKGVVIDHNPVVNLLFALRESYPFYEKDSYLLKTSYLFDVSVTELFGWFLEGGKVVALEKDGEKDPLMMLNIIEKYFITHINFVPSMFNAFLEILDRQNVAKLSALKYIFLAGEALFPELVKKFLLLDTKIELKNLYGPTEATVYAGKYSLSQWNRKDNIPIGKPLQNVQLYILNRYDNIQPIGVPGELFISGRGVGRGYLNNPIYTEARFAAYPFRKSDRLYRTGDLGRWLPDGNIEFLGRLDDQVKIRGYRIELGEIEFELQQHEKIKEAKVLEKEDKQGDKYLCAYVVPEQGAEVGLTEIRDYLARELPDYMIPAYFVKLQKFPLTPNGKIDRNALPDAKKTNVVREGEYRSAKNKIEKKLVDVWRDVLGRGDIGVVDDFFVIGGDSIKAIQIAARMYKAKYKLEIRDIFRYPAIWKLAPHVKKVERTPGQSVAAGPLPLTAIQKWFFESGSADPHHFNHAVMFHSQDRLDDRGMEKVFRKIQEHHDALRMTFKKVNGEIIQDNHGLEYPFSFEVYDFGKQAAAAAAVEQKAEKIQAAGDLERGPLMKVALFHLNDSDRLLIVIHHLVIDGVSWRILFEDIETLYKQYKNGETFALPLKTDSFKLWSEKLQVYASNGELSKAGAYWAGVEAAAITPLTGDFDEENNYIRDMERLSFSLNEQETSSLLTEVNFAFGTEINDILLTALGLAVKETFGSDRFCLALEGHGREEFIQDININRTVGWFTSLYPVILNISQKNDLTRQIKEVKEMLRRIPRKGVDYGILKYLTPPERKKGIVFNLKPQISFNYLGQFDAELEKTSFSAAAESSGQTQSPNRKREYELEITAVILGNVLELSIGFSKKQYKAGTIEKLLDRYKEKLSRVIAFCSVRKERELTPTDLSYKGLSIACVDRLTRLYPFEDLYRLSPMQAGILYHSMNEKQAATYFMQICYDISGEMDIEIAEKSLNELFRRHDILRTVFVHEGLDQPVQLVLKERKVDFYYEDISDAGTRDEKSAIIEAYRRKDSLRLFDLSKDRLMRVAIIKTGEKNYKFIWSLHHIVLDGWCIGILSAEFLKLYYSSLLNREAQLPPVPQYKTFLHWLAKQKKDESMRYWDKYLKDYSAPAGIPRINDVRAGSEKGYEREEVVFTLKEKKVQDLKQMAGKYHVTLNTIIQAAWAVVLGKYNGIEDVVFGAVVSGRPAEIEGIESIVGLFINTIPVRVRFESATLFSELSGNLQQAAIASEPHHYCPLVDIQSLSTLKQNLLDHILTFENFPVESELDEMASANGETNRKLLLEISNVKAYVRSNYDLEVEIVPKDRLKITLRYNDNVYEKKIVEKVGHHFCSILEQAAHNMEVKIEEFDLLTGDKKEKMLNRFNDEL